MILGDAAYPYGLWKCIEHMRRGEKAKIMVKPKWAFRHPEYQEYLRFPPGWDEGENKEILKKRRVFYEVKLYDWVVRHDLNGDGMLIKTILDKGVGYDRPFDYDEIKIDLKLFQIVDEKEVIYLDIVDKDTLMHD